MPSLQQANSFNACTGSDLGTGANILQTHSINSLMNNLMNDNGLVQPGADGEIGYSDFMGSSSPNPSTGPMQCFTSTPKPHEFFNLEYLQTLNAPNGNQRNLSSDFSVTSSSSPLTPSSTINSKGPFRGSPPSYIGYDISKQCSLSSGSTLGSPIEQNTTFFGGSLSRSNSPILDGNSGNCGNSGNQENVGPASYETAPNMNDIINFLQLNYTQSNQQPYMSSELQNLQALQAFRMFQQQAIQQQMQGPFQQMLQQQFLQNCTQNNAKNQQLQNPTVDSSLDRVAKFHRSSAALYDPTCTWGGVLPPRSHRFITYSPKVFLGGIPWDISEQSLMQIFKPFGQIRVEWPGKEQNVAQPKGYVYIIFDTEKQVKCLLQACSIQDNFTSNNHSSTSSIPSSCSSISSNSGNYYYKISSKRIKAKEVEVIPWIIGDSNYVKSTSQKLDPTKTVFVGALHGKLTAEGLAKIMNDLFGGVVYAGIDTDKYKYPIGSGRVTFNSPRSYMRAVSAAFIEIKTSKFTKKVQVDPYLEDSLCSMCGVQHGPYYCRESACFRYFCRQCWQMRHSNDVYLRNHKPLTRNSKSQQIIGVGPQSSSNGQHQFNSQLTNENSSQNAQNTQSSPVANFNSILNPLSFGMN